MHEDGATPPEAFIWINFLDIDFPYYDGGDFGKVAPPAAHSPTVTLFSPFPNPSRGAATITFELAEAAAVRLAVYDLAGRKMRTLADAHVANGKYEVTVTGLAPGVYVYRLETPKFCAAKKMVVVK